MKNTILVLCFIFCTSLIPLSPAPPLDKSSATTNLFIILTDGFRWQEVFDGADSTLINDLEYTPDTATLKLMYWSSSREERRKKLMPFFWNVIAEKGQLFGNRDLDSKVNTSNLYSVSYPGYNEIFTGTPDILITGNEKKNNRNINVLESLARHREFSNKIAIFSSWDVFPYILNKERNQLPINSGYALVNNGEGSDANEMINEVQVKAIKEKKATRYDLLTFLTAREYIKNHLPRIVVISLGETDDHAHEGRYDHYLQQANQFDRMVGELWHLVQTSPEYKDQTSFLISTDHGRGKKSRRWKEHGFWVNGSSETWMALMGPSIKPGGEMNGPHQFYNKQMAEMIANLVGRDFKGLSGEPVAFSK